MKLQSKSRLYCRARGCLVLFVLLAIGCRSSFEVRDRPISFSVDRVEATRQYIAQRYKLDVESIRIAPRMIVVHWTAIDDAEDSFDVFDQEFLNGSRPDIAAAGAVNVSAHFLVDRKGRVWRLMPEDLMARHTIGLNYSAIAIENVGGQGGRENLTRRQLEANAALVRRLVSRYPTIDYLIGHYEYRDFEEHPLWLEVDPEYRTVKQDPGENFMQELRKAVSDLNLQGVPSPE